MCPVGKFGRRMGGNVSCAGSCSRGSSGHNVTFSTSSVLKEPTDVGRSYSIQTGIVCKPCTAGKTEHRGVCRSCSFGKYQDLEGGIDACKICPSGKYVEHLGASRCKSCEFFWEIPNRQKTKCILSPVVYFIVGIANMCFVFYLILKAYCCLKEHAMDSANEKFQDDLNNLGGMNALTNLRTSFSFKTSGMSTPLIPKTDSKVELDLVEIKIPFDGDKEEQFNSTQLEVIDAWEKLEYNVYRAKTPKELIQAFQDVLLFSKRAGVDKFLKTKKQKVLSISRLKKGGGVVRTSFVTNDDAPIENRGVNDKIWDESVAKIFGKVLQVLS